MIVYLAGEAYGKELFKDCNYKFNRLDTFYSIYNGSQIEKNINLYNRYILDSGAFTFIMANKNNKKIKVDIDNYTDKYIDYINNNNISLFFEMDVDSIYGYSKVLSLRKRIENGTNKKCIPVFHKSRGLLEYEKDCEKYNYVSIGIAGKDTSYTDIKTFNGFIQIAKKHNCNVHGLGITGMNALQNCPFYSVDSSSWTAGNRYKGIVKFDGKKIIQIKGLENKRIKNQLGLARNNFNEWLKFANSMENKIVI